MAAGRGIKH
jgi:hypothetical protein